MTNLREYNMNGTIILGVDAGYGNFKRRAANAEVRATQDYG